MNREIKFRIFDKENNQFKNNLSLEHIFAYYECEPDRYEITQCTGLHDKNGKEIWEGDVVKWEEEEIESGKFIIKIKNLVVSWSKVLTGFEPFIDMEGPLSEECEVIGNIFENKDLVKQ